MRGNSADAAVGDAQNPYRHGEEYIEPGGDAEKAAGGPGPAQSQLGPDVLHTQHKVDAHRHQQRTEGGDVDGDEIHPAPHARQGFQEQAGEEGGRAHQEGGNGAGQAEGGGEGLAAGLQHVHQGGDARKEHGDEEEQGEDAPAGHLLEDLGEGDEHELRPAGGVDAEGKHRGQDGEARQQGGQGVHREHRAVRVGVGQLGQQKVDGLVGAGKPAGEPDVEHILARGKKPLQQLAGVLQIRQRRRDDLALAHHGVELLKIGLLPLEVTVMLLAIHHERERKDMQVELVDDLLSEIGGGIGDDGEGHGGLLIG